MGTGKGDVRYRFVSDGSQTIVHPVGAVGNQRGAEPEGRSEYVGVNLDRDLIVTGDAYLFASVVGSGRRIPDDPAVLERTYARIEDAGGAVMRLHDQPVAGDRDRRVAARIVVSTGAPVDMIARDAAHMIPEAGIVLGLMNLHHDGAIDGDGGVDAAIVLDAAVPGDAICREPAEMIPEAEVSLRPMRLHDDLAGDGDGGSDAVIIMHTASPRNAVASDRADMVPEAEIALGLMRLHHLIGAVHRDRRGNAGVVVVALPPIHRGLIQSAHMIPEAGGSLRFMHFHHVAGVVKP